MNRLAFGGDRLVLIYVLVVGWLCLYVPWMERGRYGDALGYWFLWDRPPYGGRVDLVRLVLEVVAATAVLVALAAWREWWRRRRLQASASGPTGLATKGVRDVALTPRTTKGIRDVGGLLLVIVIGLGVAVVAWMILSAIANLFSIGR